MCLGSSSIEPRHEKIGFFAYAKTKTQISFAVTAKLISAFVFAIQIVQSLFYLNPKVQASSHLQWLYSPVCVGPGRKPEDRFSHNEAQLAPISIIDYHRLQIPMVFRKNKSVSFVLKFTVSFPL